MKARRPELMFILMLTLLASTASMFAQQARGAQEGAHPYAAGGLAPAPRLFAEGVVNTGADEYGPAFTPDGRTVYFAKRSADRKTEHIYYSRFDRDRWQEPQVAPFSGKYFDKEPFVTPDGSKLFFSSTRPVEPSAPGRNDFNLWVVERTAAAGANWGVARPLGAEVNSDTYDNYPSAAANGNLYFSSTRAGGQGRNDIYRARLVNGRYAPAENLLSLNTPQSDADPYIAPDESYIIISTTRTGSYGEGDLYVSFRVGDAWTRPRNLGAKINSETYEYTPLVSLDGKYLFFSRGWGDIYQMEVSALPLRREATDSVAANDAPRRRLVAVTFDDLPFTGDGGKTTLSEMREFTAKLLSTFASHKIPAIGFVNERKLQREGEHEARAALLKMWTDAGHELGNHTYGHAGFYTTPLAVFQQQVIDGEPVTRSLLAARGMKLRYFRHPYLNTGPDLKTKEAFERFLAARGYRVAPVTIDNAEWIFAAAYAQALQRGDRETAGRIADEYVPYMERMFEFYEGMSIELFGREIAQTLLVHANALNADHFGRIAAMMKRRGYEFVTLDEALQDKAYEHSDAYTGPVGISWLQRWAITRGGKFKKEPALSPYMRQFDPAGSGSDYKTGQGQ